MKNPTAIVPRCTAQRGNGEFCDIPTAPDMPFPICTKHAVKVFMRIKEGIDAGLAIMANRAPDTEADELRRAAQASQSVVYYVRLGDHIKIGYTVNLKRRLVGLRVDADMVLATEPGGQLVEADRHKQFAAERIGRRENFNPSPRLLEHIAKVRAEHGEPKITTLVKLN